jgi:hypothetical protein
MAQRKGSGPRADDWTDVLVMGRDFFGMLEPFGWENATIKKPVNMGAAFYKAYPAALKPKPEDPEFLAAALAAWHQDGAAIMRRWRAARHPEGERQEPEAFLRWGEPATSP